MSLKILLAAVFCIAIIRAVQLVIPNLPPYDFVDQMTLELRSASNIGTRFQGFSRISFDQQHREWYFADQIRSPDGSTTIHKVSLENNKLIATNFELSVDCDDFELISNNGLTVASKFKGKTKKFYIGKLNSQQHYTLLAETESPAFKYFFNRDDFEIWLLQVGPPLSIAVLKVLEQPPRIFDVARITPSGKEFAMDSEFARLGFGLCSTNHHVAYVIGWNSHVPTFFAKDPTTGKYREFGGDKLECLLNSKPFYFDAEVADTVCDISPDLRHAACVSSTYENYFWLDVWNVSTSLKIASKQAESNGLSTVIYVGFFDNQSFVVMQNCAFYCFVIEGSTVRLVEKLEKASFDNTLMIGAGRIEQGRYWMIEYSSEQKLMKFHFVSLKNKR